MKVKDFDRDLAQAQEVEKAVAAHLSTLTNDYSFSWIGDQSLYYHKGDVVATNKVTGEQFFIEVKNDSRIHETFNVLLEDEVQYKDWTVQQGNLYSDYEIYCVVSLAARKMWIMDLKVLKNIHKQGEYTMIKHSDQTTFAWLLPLHKIKKAHGLIAQIEF